MKLPNVKKPCKDCPFKKNTLKGWLGKERMTEILEASSFTCHKHPKQLQCAGHMLLKGEENMFVRLADSMGLDTGLRGREGIFENKNDCINHHE